MRGLHQIIWKLSWPDVLSSRDRFVSLILPCISRKRKVLDHARSQITSDHIIRLLLRPLCDSCRIRRRRVASGPRFVRAYFHRRPLTPQSLLRHRGSQSWIGGCLEHFKHSGTCQHLGLEDLGRFRNCWHFVHFSGSRASSWEPEPAKTQFESVEVPNNVIRGFVTSMTPCHQNPSTLKDAAFCQAMNRSRTGESWRSKSNVTRSWSQDLRKKDPPDAEDDATEPLVTRKGADFPKSHGDSQSRLSRSKSAVKLEETQAEIGKKAQKIETFMFFQRLKFCIVHGVLRSMAPSSWLCQAFFRLIWTPVFRNGGGEWWTHRLSWGGADRGEQKTESLFGRAPSQAATADGQECPSSKLDQEKHGRPTKSRCQYATDVAKNKSCEKECIYI